jgi:predicted ATPase
MIPSVTFHNFKGLRQVELTLERFTVLVGPNASGKTSILEGLYSLVRSATNWSVELAGFGTDLSLLCTRGTNANLEIILPVGSGRAKLWLQPTAPGPGVKQGMLWEPGEGAPWREHDPRLELNGPFPAVSLLRLDARRLAAPSYSEDSRPTVGADGQGLASALAYLALNRPADFQQLQELLKTVVPYVQRVRFDRVEVSRPQGRRWGEQIVFDMKGAPNIPSHLASDGTLIVLGLLTVLLETEGPHLLLLDDLDQGLHPRAQRDLMVLLRRLLQEKPDLQIVATTHSPYLLDQLEAKEVRLTTRRDDGSVACARLDEHPDFERWKEAMTPGEFWSMVGEKWVAERQPQEVGA